MYIDIHYAVETCSPAQIIVSLYGGLFAIRPVEHRVEDVSFAMGPVHGRLESAGSGPLAIDDRRRITAAVGEFNWNPPS